jgi:hypothetical protein
MSADEYAQTVRHYAATSIAFRWVHSCMGSHAFSCRLRQRSFLPLSLSYFLEPVLAQIAPPVSHPFAYM